MERARAPRMKIGELAQKAGLSPSTVRYYESVGLLSAPPRASGRRVYGNEVVAQLRAITALKYAGFRLAEIQELVPVLASGRTPSVRWRRAAQAKIEELSATIADLTRARRMLARAIECACGGDPAACELVLAAHSRAAASRGRVRKR